MDDDRARSEPERPAGQYANYFEVGHNAFEFVIDFGQCYTASDAPRLHTRIVTGPGYARALMSLLAESIARHEATYGARSQAVEERAGDQ